MTIATDEVDYLRASKEFAKLVGELHARVAWRGKIKTLTTMAVTPNKERRRREPVPWTMLPEWKAKVEALPAVRGSYLMFVLVTGLRSADAACLRWVDLDMETGIMNRGCPKGGPERAFSVPLSRAALDVLAGCPGRDGRPLSSRRWSKKRGDSPHRLRDTFVGAGMEAHVDLFSLKVLCNHALSGSDVTTGYFRPSVEHLRGCINRIAEFLVAKMSAVAE